MDIAHHINWILLDGATGDTAHVGDLISADAGGLPVYRVLGLQDRRAWLKDERDGSNHIMPLGQFRWRAVSAAF